ncbi:MAG TPA: hypothetical protein VFE59_24675 [Trebonia sp.]|jgi:hypothetical protein|nr:hypothetical protein [Trebonia sp.]
MPAWGERRIPVSVRDDTVSTGRPAAGHGAVAVLADAHGVVFLLVAGSGCGAAAGLAACNTNRPLAAARPPGTVDP